MRAALFLARSDLRRTLRQRETWIWTFLMPIVFFYFFSTIQSDPSPSGPPGAAAERRDPLTLLVPGEGGALADELERRLELEGYEVTRVGALPEGEPPARLLRVPERFTERLLAGEDRLPVRLEREGGGNPAELDRFRVSRAVYGVLADVVAVAARGDVQEPAAYAALAAWPRSLRVAVRPAGARRTIPSGREQSIPGTLVMFTMIVLLTSGSIGLVIERRDGLLRRLAATPLTRGQVVAGKWLGVLLLGVVQVAFGVLAGTLLFRLRWGPDFAVLALVLLAWAAFCSSLALLLASLARTEGQCVGIAVLSANVLAALGGCWWPIEVTPRWMQELASWLPTGWVMNALHRLMIFQTGPSGALAALAWLGLGALALGALAARRVRYHPSAAG
jgi:ABC-type multidrug transport system permease subunit